MGMTIGLDLGSTAIKAVIVEYGEMIWKKAVPTAPGQEKIATGLVEQGLADLGRDESEVDGTAVTGYGKRLVNGAQIIVDEVSANVKGVFALSAGAARTIINIGGQDVKVIRVSDAGRLADFRMNDKCAAGTGRFFEVAGRILDTPVTEFGTLGIQAKHPARINNTCTVFAESEIVSLMAEGADREDIIQGLHASVARRISSLAGVRLEDAVFLDGGSAANGALALAVEDEMMRDVFVLPHPQFTVAFGAALCLSDDWEA